MIPDPRSFPKIPAETFQAVRKVYNIENIYLVIGDHLEEILDGIDFSLLDPSSSLNADTAAKLALVTAFQFAEGLPDPLAAEATQKRMDWKYALHQPLDHPGFSAAALCRFRRNLFSSHKALPEMAQIHQRLGKKGLYPTGCRTEFDAVEAMSMSCKITRYYQLNRSMKAALSLLVTTAPDWLRDNALPHWYERYKTGSLAWPVDRTTLDLDAEARALGSDVQRLLETLSSEPNSELSAHAEIRNLAYLWREQYYLDEKAIIWRLPACDFCSGSRTH
jgi:hypothetical protein